MEELFKIGKHAAKLKEKMREGNYKAEKEYKKLCREQQATHKEMNKDFRKKYE